MILKIVLLALIFIALSLLLFFLSCLLVPAVKVQTKIDDNMLFSSIEHRFQKLEEGDVPNVRSEKKAVVLCSCSKTFERPLNVRLLKGQTCALVASEYGSANPCEFSCIGMGDCKAVCEQHAISIRNGTAVVSDLCCGCGRCVGACPKSVIKMVPRTQEREILCSNMEKSITGCSKFRAEEKISRVEKKYFKIWRFWYKMLNPKKNLLWRF